MLVGLPAAMEEMICPFAFNGRAGSVNPPVLENLDKALMEPELPIWNTDEVVTLPTRRLWMMML